MPSLSAFPMLLFTILTCCAVLADAGARELPPFLTQPLVEMDTSSDHLYHLWKRPEIPVVRMAPRPGLSFAVEKGDVGYERTITAGLTVQKGASAKVDFRITLDAVSSTTIEREDKKFKSFLTPHELKRYRKRMAMPHFGLDIPMFRMMGINLNKRVTHDTQWKASKFLKNYPQKASVVRQVLKSHVKSKVVVTGTLMATGTSTMPVTVLAFIKLSRVILPDGSIVRVVSSEPSDVTAATSCGEMMPTSNQRVDIVQL